MTASLIKCKILFATLLLALPIFGHAQPSPLDSLIRPAATIVSPEEELRADLSAMLESSDFANAWTGISVLSLESGQFLFRYNDRRNFIPASTLKLLTTAAALKYLGKDFRFVTRIYLDGEILKNGEFLGNVIIRGGGDPTMSRNFYEDPVSIAESFARMLDSLGIRSIKGNLIGDDRYFDAQYYGPGWAWDDIIYPFSSQVNALAFNDNKIDVIIRPADSSGELATIEYYPANSYVRIINNVITVPDSGITQIRPFREPKTNIIEISGTIAMDSSAADYNIVTNVTVDNPTRFFLNIFKTALTNHRIRVRGALFDISDWNRRITYKDLNPVWSIYSPPLSEIISLINKESHNLSAEMLLKTLGRESSGNGSFAGGISRLRLYASSIGIDPESISIVDGSGLSRYNLISPAYEVALLSKVYRSDFYDTFKSSLAIPGEVGTLITRMIRSRAEDNVFAKSGSMNNISTISGYVLTREKETLAFAIMMNNFTVPHSIARSLQDLILMRLASFSRKRR